MQRRVGIVQRVLTDYRKPFFDALAVQPGLAVHVCAGQPMNGETLKVADGLSTAAFNRVTNMYLQRTGSWMCCWQRGIANWLETVNPDVVVLEANPRLLSHWATISWMHHRNRPVIGWGLGSLPHSGIDRANSARTTLYRRLITSMDGMIGYGSKARNDYIAYGISPERAFIAHNSVDNSEARRFVSQLVPDSNWLIPWKQDIGLQADLLTVLFVGRMIEQKRVDILLEACAALLEQCQLLIVGDGPMMEMLKQQASQYKHSERVVFAGHLSGEALARCYIASDLFVLPGAGGLALQQAMSYGLPVVVSFGDGTEADLVYEGVNGRYFPVNDTPGLRTVISSLLEQPSLLVRMGQASNAIICSEINLAQMVKSFGEAIAAFRS